MAYNPYYPQSLGYGSGYATYQMPQMQPQPQQSNFIHVQSETQAREWAVAPNCSVTFIDDNAPYCYTKSMGMSQLEPPIFKRFRLVEEESTQNALQSPQSNANSQQENTHEYMTKTEFEPFKMIIGDLQAEIKELKKHEPFEQRKHEHANTESA